MDKREQDDTVGKDAGKALRKYLKLDEKADEKKVRQELEKRIKELEKQGAAKKGSAPLLHETSLAIASCPSDASFAEERSRLRVIKLQEANKLSLCIQFQDLPWKEYYKGGNIKYPDVRGMTVTVGKDPLLDKMIIFDLLQTERQQCCKLDPTVLTPFESVPNFANCPAIIIPSSGKGGEWLGEALSNPKDFWWVRCKGFAQIIFAVDVTELENYKPFTTKGLTVVGYQGFGMGCGRAVGINIAKQLGRICIMTDDRTKALTYTSQKDDLTEEQMASMMSDDPNAELYWGDKPFIMGVYPKGELNILTIINPLSSEPTCTFSPFFIASKEDKGLYQYCRVLQLRHGSTVGDTEYSLQVHFDSDNPVYENTAKQYKGPKGDAITCMTSSQFYCSDKNKTLDWKYLNKGGPGGPGFLNPWDAVKMQDSAMFLLLTEIAEEILKYNQAENVPAKVWESFDRFIAPWFS